MLITVAVVLALTITRTVALDKKRECIGKNEVDECFDAAEKDDTEILCSKSCKSTLTDYFSHCRDSDEFESFRLEYRLRCGATATVVTLLTIILPVLVVLIN